MLSVRTLLGWSLVLSLSAPLGAAVPDASRVRANAPVQDFVLPTFTKEGHRDVLLRAGQATFVSTTEIRVTDLNMTKFSGDALTTVDTLLLSPSATVFTEKQLVTGDQSVRFIRDDVEITGERWTYQHGTTEKKVTIGKNARVVFHFPLNAILP